MNKIGTIKPGIYRNMRFADYLAEPAMSASRLKLLYKSHRDFIKGIRSTESMKAGTLEHLAVLEHNNWNNMVVVTPRNRTNEKGKEVNFVRSGAHWKQFQDENKGKLIITAKENEQCMEVAHEVYSNPESKKWLTGEKEVSIFWNDPVFGPSKLRADNLGHTYMTDLKRTASDLSKFGFTCDKLGYDIQAAWYLRGASAVGLHKVESFIFVAVFTFFNHHPVVGDECGPLVHEMQG